MVDRYRADIEGMRGIAVFLVLLFHFSILTAVKGGFMGVDIFFVISGFLITGIIKRDLDAGSFSFLDFYLRRIRRLSPALGATLVLVFAAGSLTLFPDDLRELARQAAAAQLYFANIYYWRSVNYFGLRVDDVYLLHTWSLSVEEQFYLFYPFCLYLMNRYLSRYFWHVIGIACAASFILDLALIAAKPEAVFYLLPTRGWELLLGALCHPVATTIGSRRVSQVMGWGGVLLIAIAVFAYRPTIQFPGIFALIPALGSACLIVSGSISATTVSRALAWRPLTRLGHISYSLYLVHWPVNAFARQLFINYGVPQRVLMLLLSIALAVLIQALVEDPMRRKWQSVSTRQVLASYSALVCATLVVFVAVEATRGLPGRFRPEAVRLASFANDKPDEALSCELLTDGDADRETCKIGDPSKPPTWLVFGDSHAWAANGVFDLWLRNKGQAGIFTFRHSCLPLIGLGIVGDRGACDSFTSRVIRLVNGQPAIRNVAIVSTWRQAIEGRLTDRHGTGVPAVRAETVFRQALHETLVLLGEHGRQTYVWAPVPGAHRAVPQALAHAYPEFHPRGLELTSKEYKQTFGFFFEALAENNNLVSGIFLAARDLCASGRCAVQRSGVPLYFDDGHISASSHSTWIGALDAMETSDTLRNWIGSVPIVPVN